MKKMTKGMLMTALICGAVYLGGSPVYASELQEFSLDEYVVTAARTETKLVDTPANISVVDAQTIEERHYQDVSEVLKDVPGANVLDVGHGASEKKIVLNGDERVLIMVDGRRLNLDMGTMTRSGYDMNQMPDVSLIERIEVLKGAGGALYGSDAVGGVVNIITKKANRSYGKVSVAMGSMGAKDYNAMYSIKEGKTGVSVAASKYEQDYYKYRDAKSDTTHRWPGNTNYKNEKVSIKLDNDITAETSITVGYDYSKYEGFSPTYAVMPSHAALDKKTENMYLKYDWNKLSKNSGYVQIYHNEFQYNTLSLDPTWPSYGDINEKTLGFDVQQEITVAENNKFVLGSSWRKSDVKTLGDNVYNESIDNLAFYINNTWEFKPSWTLNTGIRYDEHSEVGDETTLSAGINKKIDDNSHMYVNWGQVFRAPTTDDLYYSTSYMHGNKNLEAETGETWTIGYSTELNNKTNLSVNYFESDIDNAIDWAEVTSYSYYAENLDSQKRKGLEFTVNHKLNNNLDLTASYTYLQVKSSRDNTEIRDYNHIPNIYRLGLNYEDGKWNTNIWLRAGSGACTNLNQYYSYGTLGSRYSYLDSNYLTIDVAVTYHASKDLSFYAKGYNLFNEAYAEQAGVSGGSYRYPAQSRRFIVGAEYKF